MYRLWSCALIPGSCLGIFSSGLAQAQIVPDNTLPNNSVVTPSGNTNEITGGTTVNNSLFHSFERFSVPTGGEAFFNNPQAIENIFTRVTGRSISNIDGTIRANGVANLFLLNPNGILFGPNASLNIGGSFVATTADSYRWANGSKFSAINPQAPPLLTINVPIGLQTGSNPGQIVVQGTGNNLGLDPNNFEIIRDFRPAGLQVKPGKTLALVGGDILLEGGNLTAEGGRVELWSVKNGRVLVGNVDGDVFLNKTRKTLDYGNIQLSQASSVDTSGVEGGNIWIQGRNLTLTDGSIIFSNTLGTGSGTGGNLIVNISESVNVQGISPFSPIPSGLFVDTASGSNSQGGNLTIETDRLRVADGGQIGSNTFGSGKAGNLSVRSQNIELSGGAFLGPSGLFAGVAPGAAGKGGNLTIATERLQIIGGAQVSVSTFGSGDAGNLSLRASEVAIFGTFPGGDTSGLFANVEPQARGSGGNLTIEANRLRIADGAVVGASTFGIGNAGSLTVKAQTIEVIGEGANGTSLLATTVAPGATGQGGDLTIETGRLYVSDGGQIAVSTGGDGNAGELIINANRVELIGSSERSASGLLANAVIGTGDGGNIKLNADRLIILDGATISTSNFSTNPNFPPGQGQAGNIDIKANSLFLDRQSSITAATNTGGGGNINIYVDKSLIARNNSQISAETFGIGDGGTINIAAESLEIASGSEIVSDSEGLGQAGDISITADRINLNRGNIAAISKQTGGGDISLTSEFILLENGSMMSTSVLDSTGGGGDININTDIFVAIENSDIRADAVRGAGGNIQINAQGLFLSPDSDITASSRFGVDGTIEIIDPNVNRTLGLVQLPETMSDPTQLVASSCVANRENVFAVTGKGGLPEDPSQTLRGETYWVDRRSVDRTGVENVQDSPPVESNLSSRSQDSIVEAKGWVINEDGTLLLVAEPVDPIINPSGQQKPLCGGTASAIRE